MNARITALCFLILILPGQTWGQAPPYLHAPAVNVYAKHNPSGATILPDGRLLKPVGTSYAVSKWPHGLALSPDGTTAFVASRGVGQFIKNWSTPQATMTQVFPTDNGSNSGAAVFSPDGSTLYWSTGDTGGVYIVNVQTAQVTAEISLNATVGKTAFADSFVMDMKLDPTGRYLYCADVTNFRVAVIDLQQKSVVGSTAVGRYPYALATAAGMVYVANIGMFEYQPVPAPTSGSFDSRGLTFPAFGIPSAQAENGVQDEGRFVPGLGAPNAPESFSVWSINVSNPATPVVYGQWKTGLQIGQTADAGAAVGGSAPDFVLVQGSHVWVADGNNDTVDALNAATGKVQIHVPIRPSSLVSKLRGIMPTGMALSPDGTRLYVCEMAINAIAVIDTSTGTILGHIPTAWYPYRVAASPDGKHLACICFRGFGNGPNAGSSIPTDPFVGMQGAFTVISIPTSKQLATDTTTVLANAGMVDASKDRASMSSPVIPTTPGTASSQIKYVVFITKENHTYDTIFDHVSGANADSSLLQWGLHQTISAPGEPTLTNVAVMTNHNALARQFSISDNFYMEPELSGVGHRWLVGIQPNNFCQMTYTLGWTFILNSTAPGRRASFGSDASMAPEDYPEAGAVWDQLNRHGVKFRNYGEGFEFAGIEEDDDEAPTGARETVNIPMPKILYDNTCRDFPIFNMNIPDQFRAQWFEKDFTSLCITGKQTMPGFINIAICNDHGTDPNPSRGYPYVASWMADNDLALGKIVDFLSHTKYWKNMAIFVTQDDSGNEQDHIDAQRSVQLIISPWAKRGYVSHRLTTIVSMHRTLYEILGLPPLNMFDALANDFSDCFTTTPNYTPYTYMNVDSRVFNPNAALDADDPNYVKARKMRSIVRDDPAELDRLAKEEAREGGK